MELTYRKRTPLAWFMNVSIILIMVYFILGLLGSIDFFSYEKFSFYTIGLLLIIAPSLIAFFKQPKGVFTAKGMTLEMPSKVEISNKDVEGVYRAIGNIGIKTADNYYSFPTTYLKNQNNFYQYLVRTLGFKKIPFYKPPNLKSLVNGLLFLLAVIFSLIGLFDRDDSLKYQLPLSKVEVQELEGTMTKNLTINYPQKHALVRLAEYPEFTFVYSRKLKDQALTFKDGTGADLKLERGSKVKIKIRKDDFRYFISKKRNWMEIRDPFQNWNNRINFYSLQKENQLLMEKVCLK